MLLIVLTAVMAVALLQPLALPHAKAQAVPCAEIADKAKSYLEQSERYWQMGGAENLRAADITIKRGLIGNLTQEMIAQAESKVRDLQGRLATPRPADLKAFSVLPGFVQQRLRPWNTRLGGTWTRLGQSSGAFSGKIVLKPTPEGLKAQLQGNIRGLLTFDEQAPVFLRMVAGGRFFLLPTLEAVLA